MHPRIFNAKSVGFTLIELLVVIAIVAIILAILLPALSKARAASRSAVCLSNHRQIGIAWQTYLNEFNNFPIGEDPDIITKYREDFNWGGVFWYDPNIWRPGDHASVRPLNPYLGHPLVETTGAEVFRCPLDYGVYDYISGQRILSHEGPHVTYSKAPNPRTDYGSLGNSYRSNEWMYCAPGERTGWGPPPARPHYRSNLGPKNVQISTSRFVLFADDGPFMWMLTKPSRRLLDSGGSWWHDFERCPMSFLDGSTRIEKAGLIVSPTYSLHMVPIYRPNLNFDFRWPGRQ